VGGGNNGGDGLFAAADLRARGMQVTCLLAHDRPHCEGLAAARRAGVRMVDLAGVAAEELAARAGPPAPVATATATASSMRSDAIQQITRWGIWADVWVDALAGIGVQGVLRDLPASVVAALARVRTRSPVDPLVVAVDVPSGV